MSLHLVFRCNGFSNIRLTDTPTLHHRIHFPPLIRLIKRAFLAARAAQLASQVALAADEAAPFPCVVFILRSKIPKDRERKLRAYNRAWIIGRIRRPFVQERSRVFGPLLAVSSFREWIL